MTELTQDRLKQCVKYDEKTGIFIRLAAGSNTHFVGKQCGVIDKYGYVRFKVCGAVRLAHRLAWLYVHGDIPKGQIDHINGVRTDNRISNLREVTNQQNSENIKTPRPNSSTGLLGVSWHPSAKAFVSQINAGGKKLHLGCFKTKEEAHAAYIKAKKKFHPSWVPSEDQQKILEGI